MDVSVYNTRVMGPAHVENVTELACRTALARRGVAHVTMPVDFQEQPIEKSKTSNRNVPGQTSDVFARRAALPDEAHLPRAADVLTADTGRRVSEGRRGSDG